MSSFKCPLKISEATIQAEFFHQSRIIGLNCLLELHTPVGRLDLAIFNEDWSKMVAVVEVKRHTVRHTTQIARYKSLQLPVFGLCKLERCEKLARQIQRDCKDGKSIEDIMESKRLIRNYISPKTRAETWRMQLDSDINLKE